MQRPTERTPQAHGQPSVGASVRPALWALLALLLAAPALAEPVIEHWGAGDRCAHKKALKIAVVSHGEAAAEGSNGPWVVKIDLTALPARAKIHRASLLIRRSPIDGRDAAALVNVEVAPLAAGTDHPTPGEPLKLEAPWFAGFDVTETVRTWSARPGTDHALLVKSCPGFEPEATRLEIMYETMRAVGAGRAAGEPAPVKAVQAVHRAGQTFITFGEIDDLVGNEPPTWGRVKKLLEEMDAKNRVRYLVYRDRRPITPKTIASATLLARLRPLSAYNTRGRSVEELIAMIRRRAIDDTALARRLARRGLRFGANSPEMAEVVIKRLAIVDDKPLPAATGLYVHSPAKAGKAYYAVVAAVDGTANLRQVATVSVDEVVGAGEPVRQPAADVTVFYDYPGRRSQYVQWTAPPLSNLPNQYYNWSVYLPRDPPKPTPVRVAFTGTKFIKPGVRHRADTILISGQDTPIWSQWYGYHESLGTLRSFKQGSVRPFTRRRLFAFIDWAIGRFGGDAKRVSCIGGSDALYYGVKHGDRFAYVLTRQPDPYPLTTPASVMIQGYRRSPPRPQREAAWGKPEWKIPGEGGKPAWDEFDLIGYVKDPKRELAFLSMGPAQLSAPWGNQVKFMKQLWASNHGFAARFYWGGGEHLPIPEGRVGAKDTFDFALDLPFLALRNNSNDRGLTTKQFTTGTPGYGSGGRIADGRRWLADVVDEADRFEITIHGRGRVTYAGGGTSDVTIRRARTFKPAPGSRVRWENAPLKGSGGKPQSGEVTVDADGLVTIPKVSFQNPSRLKVYLAK